MEDMANMTYLNEASVLCNLRERYERFMIYVSGGGLCFDYMRRFSIGLNVTCRFKCSNVRFNVNTKQITQEKQVD